jgi:hypothetical protein
MKHLTNSRIFALLFSAAFSTTVFAQQITTIGDKDGTQCSGYPTCRDNNATRVVACVGWWTGADDSASLNLNYQVDSCSDIYQCTVTSGNDQLRLNCNICSPPVEYKTDQHCTYNDSASTTTRCCQPDAKEIASGYLGKNAPDAYKAITTTHEDRNATVTRCLTCG